MELDQQHYVPKSYIKRFSIKNKIKVYDRDLKKFFITNPNNIAKEKGYIIDDGQNRLYTTSDTICFKNDYKADILCIPVTGHGLTMSAFEASLYAKEIGAVLTIPIHMDNPIFPPDFDFIKEMFEKYEVEYEILDNDESIEIE